MPRANAPPNVRPQDNHATAFVFPPEYGKILERKEKYKEPTFEASSNPWIFSLLSCYFKLAEGFLIRIEPRLARFARGAGKPDSRGSLITNSDRKALRPDGEGALCTPDGKYLLSLFSVEVKTARHSFGDGLNQLKKYMTMFADSRAAKNLPPQYQKPPVRGLYIHGGTAYLYEMVNKKVTQKASGDLADPNSPVSILLQAIAKEYARDTEEEAAGQGQEFPQWFRAYVEQVERRIANAEAKAKAKTPAGKAQAAQDVAQQGIQEAEGDDPDQLLDHEIFRDPLEDELAKTAPAEASLYAIIFAIFDRKLPRSQILLKPQAIIPKRNPVDQRGHKATNSYGSSLQFTQIGVKPDFIGAVYGSYRSGVPQDTMVFLCEVKAYYSKTHSTDVIAQIQKGINFYNLIVPRKVKDVILLAVLGLRVWELTGTVVNGEFVITTGNPLNPAQGLRLLDGADQLYAKILKEATGLEPRR